MGRGSSAPSADRDHHRRRCPDDPRGLASFVEAPSRPPSETARLDVSDLLIRVSVPWSEPCRMPEALDFSAISGRPTGVDPSTPVRPASGGTSWTSQTNVVADWKAWLTARRSFSEAPPRRPWNLHLRPARPGTGRYPRPTRPRRRRLLPESPRPTSRTRRTRSRDCQHRPTPRSGPRPRRTPSRGTRHRR